MYQTNKQTYLLFVLQSLLAAVTAQVLVNSSLEDYLVKLAKFLQFFSMKLSIGKSVAAVIVEVRGRSVTLLCSMSFDSSCISIIPSNQKSRISRVDITSDLLPGKLNLAAKWAIGRTNRIHLLATKGCQRKRDSCVLKVVISLLTRTVLFKILFFSR